jgi:hypothetical protein
VPFWWWLATQSRAQVELPHPSRDGIFSTPLDAELFFWGMYGAFLVLAPAGFAVLLARRGRSAWPIGAAIVMLGVLGLGTLTPLPRILFGYADLWQWLVYDRFAIWAAVLSTLPASVFVQRIVRCRVRWPVGSLIAAVLVIVVARETTLTLDQPLQPRPLQGWEEREILKFLDSDNHADWNYVTLGLGEAEFARLSRLTNARTMDGLYYTARERSELRASGVGSIDSAYWWRTGLEILPQIIQQPERWNLKWAIVAIPQLEEQLRSAGWKKLYNLGSPGSFEDVPTQFFRQSAESQAAFRANYGDQAALVWAAEHGGPPITSLVSIWTGPSAVAIPPLPPVVAPAYPALIPALWGTVPLMLLGLGLVLAIMQRWEWTRRRAKVSATRWQRHRGLALPAVFSVLSHWNRQ